MGKENRLKDFIEGKVKPSPEATDEFVELCVEKGHSRKEVKNALELSFLQSFLNDEEVWKN